MKKYLFIFTSTFILSLFFGCSRNNTPKKVEAYVPTARVYYEATIIDSSTTDVSGTVALWCLYSSSGNMVGSKINVLAPTKIVYSNLKTGDKIYFEKIRIGSYDGERGINSPEVADVGIFVGRDTTSFNKNVKIIKPK